jgi:hypothetical protein
MTGKQGLMALPAIGVLVQPGGGHAVDRLAMRADKVGEFAHEIHLRIAKLFDIAPE